MPTRAASPSSSASSESPSSSSSSSAERGVDISGYRLVAVMAFVVFTFGLFLYLQHDVLISAEESLELHSPPTIQNGRRPFRANEDGRAGIVKDPLAAA